MTSVVISDRFETPLVNKAIRSLKRQELQTSAGAVPMDWRRTPKTGVRLVDIDFESFSNSMAILGERYRDCMSSPINERNLVGLSDYSEKIQNLLYYTTAEGQGNLIRKLLSTVKTINGLLADADRSRDEGKLVHYSAVFIQQVRKLSNLVRANSVLAQHYGIDRIARQKPCQFSVDGYHKVCQTHPTRVEYATAEDLENMTRGLKRLRVCGLIDRDAAYGTFADLEDYENYVALVCARRNAEAAQYAAALAGGAHPHSLRDPFPYGHCKLLMFRPPEWASLFRRGEDCLSKEFLDANRNRLHNEKVVCLIIDPANQQVHLSMAVSVPQNAIGVLVRVSELVKFLDKAFEDGVCDFEELQSHFYEMVPATRS